MKLYCFICSNEDIYALYTAHGIFNNDLVDRKSERLFCKECFNYNTLDGKYFDSDKTIFNIKAIKRYISTKIIF